MERLIEIEEELEKMAEREAIALWRFARHGIDRGLTEETVTQIREEGWELWDMRNAHAERLLDRNYMRRFRWAFQLNGEKIF